MRKHFPLPLCLVVFQVLAMLTGCTSQSRKNDALLKASYSDDVVQVKQALDRGANVNAAGEYGGSALFEAAGKGNLALAQVLLDHHASVNQAMNTGDTPLHIAALRGHADMVRLLLAHGAAPNQRNKKGRTPLDLVRAARRLPSQRNSPDFIATTQLLQP